MITLRGEAAPVLSICLIKQLWIGSQSFRPMSGLLPTFPSSQRYGQLLIKFMIFVTLHAALGYLSWAQPISLEIIYQRLLVQRSNILSFHRVREAVAHGIVRPFHIDGKDNPADVLSKHTSSSVWYELMRPLIFWRANYQVDSVTQGGEGSIDVSPPSVKHTVNGTVNVNIGEPNGIIPGRVFTLMFNDERDTS